jgi:hypothetical protein
MRASTRLIAAAFLPLVVGGLRPAFSADGRTHPAERDKRRVTFRLNSLCGPTCLWQVARALGKECSLQEVGIYADTSLCGGATVEGMLKACAKLGLPAQAVRTTVDKLADDPRVPILLLKSDNLTHYVILDSIREHEVRLLDGAQFRTMAPDELKSLWTGVAILIPAPSGCNHSSMGCAGSDLGFGRLLRGILCGRTRGQGQACTSRACMRPTTR